MIKAEENGDAVDTEGGNVLRGFLHDSRGTEKAAQSSICQVELGHCEIVVKDSFTIWYIENPPSNFLDHRGTFLTAPSSVDVEP